MLKMITLKKIILSSKEDWCRASQRYHSWYRWLVLGIR